MSSGYLYQIIHPDDDDDNNATTTIIVVCRGDGTNESDYQNN
jgi:hypothetical protein